METLITALCDNDLEKVKKLLENNEQQDLTTLLNEAVSYDCLDILKWLFDEGAEINKETFKQAMIGGRYHIIEWLLDNGAEATSDALITASASGNLNLVKLLILKGADVTAEENAAAYMASFSRHFETVQYLYEQGADINGIAYKDEMMLFLFVHGEVRYNILPYK